MSEPKDYAAELDAINESIRVLRKKDRWRLHKRNRHAIKTLEETRQRIFVQALIEGPEV